MVYDQKIAYTGEKMVEWPLNQAEEPCEPSGRACDFVHTFFFL